jgi:[NiFe] hydrogenase assembly HybE family chaperone
MSVDPRTVANELAAVYREIYRATMCGVPICNDALAVEAVGFRNFEQYVVGVVVTPWFLNLVAVAQEATFTAAPAANAPAVRLRFPAGDVDFNVSELEGFGRLASCSLFSPMSEFANHDAAREAAQAALNALLDPCLNEGPCQRASTAVNGIDRRALFGGRRKESSDEVAP